MSLRDKELQEVTEADLQELVTNAIQEGREIEFKAQLPGNSEGDKREFLYDVSSFANHIGGDLIFGVKEDEGKATEVAGVEATNIDAEKLRLESLVRDGVDPRIIPGIVIHPVSLANSGSALIVRVPRSLAQPHAVTLGRAFMFYSRNSAGKYRLDVTELRRAFMGSQEMMEGIRNFRRARVALIADHETPISLPDLGTVILHIVPFRAFEPGVTYDVSILEREQHGRLQPVDGSSDGIRYNIDGLLNSASQHTPGYVQLFRNGSIEAVNILYQIPSHQSPSIHSVAFEELLINAIARYLEALQALRVDAPLALMVTLIRVKGWLMWLPPERFTSYHNHPVDRNTLLLPEVLLPDYGVDVGRVLHPVFDAVWNACGRPRSINYDSNGNWRKYTD